MKTKEEWDEYYAELVEKCRKDLENDLANGYEPPKKPFFVLNEKETEQNLFPRSKWELKLLQGDKPARFHVISGGWDVTFGIDDGEVIDILTKGTDAGVFDYMSCHIKEWLVAQSTLFDCTNKMFTKMMWYCFFSL